MLASSIEFLSSETATLVPALDEKKLRHSAQPAIKKVELVEPRDATVRLVKGKPKVIPAVNGTTVAADDLKRAVEPVLIKPAAERRVSAQLTGAKATFSTADAKKLRIKQVTGKFTTYFPYLPYRNINIGRAAALINGTLLKPGEVFSLNKIVGERTVANGFTKGFIIKGGRFRRNSVVVSRRVPQPRTTPCSSPDSRTSSTSRTVLFIDRYPPGREATVAWPGVDLKFQNDTKYGVLVQAYIVKGTPSQQGIHHGEDVVDQDLRQGRRDCSDQVQLHERAGGHRRFDEMRADVVRCRASMSATSGCSTRTARWSAERISVDAMHRLTGSPARNRRVVEFADGELTSLWRELDSGSGDDGRSPAWCTRQWPAH